MFFVCPNTKNLSGSIRPGGRRVTFPEAHGYGFRRIGSLNCILSYFRFYCNIFLRRESVTATTTEEAKSGKAI